MDNLLAFLALTLTAAAILDGVTPARQKVRIAESIRQIIQPTAGAPRLSLFFDKVFGTKVLSRRAFIVSVAFTIAFNVAAYALALILSDGSVNGWVFSNQGGSYSVWIILAIMLVSVVVADFFSIAQTRVFMRSIERYGSASVTTVMVIADLLASVFIFVVFFAIGRAICYIIVVASVLPSTIERHEVYVPGIARSVVDNFRMHSDLRRLAREHPEAASRAQARLTLALAGYGRSRQSATEIKGALLQRRFPFGDISNAVVDFRLKRRCMKADSEATDADLNLHSAFSNSITQVTQSANLFSLDPSRSETPGRYMHREYLNALSPSSSRCGVEVLEVTEVFHPRNMVRELTFFNIYLSSFYITTVELFLHIPTKFSAYQATDLNSTVTLFFQYAWYAQSSHLLGIRPTPSSTESIFLYLNGLKYEPSQNHVFIPVSTFTASSLGASFLFWLFLVTKQLLRWIVWFRSRVAFLLEGATFDALLFSPIVLFCSFLVLGIVVMSSLLGWMWSLILSSLI